ncbi:hypothetical protein Btru_072102 [Bulinus truncatus]|nr:hypothetical protein Btru_072102 [Bulinus truncatus]
MTSLESDNMDCDSGVSDMTCSESTVSDRTVSTIIGSPPSSIAADDDTIHGHTDPGSVDFPNTMLVGQNAPSSVLSPDSGIASGSVSNSSHRIADSGMGSLTGGDSQLPKERLDTSTRTQEWINTSEFEVFVKTLDGKTVTIKVEEDEEVVSFRKKVEEKTKVPESQQYLLSAGGRKLIDGERINKYDIKKHSTVYCQGRLRGG